MKLEIYISIDVETDGPIPGDYSMSSLGACLVDDPETAFYEELKPISDRFEPEAMSISGLDRELLIIGGSDPEEAMRRFAVWIGKVCGRDGIPIFVALNATFDWMFVHWYFIHFLSRDPFGHSGWDIKAYYAGVAKKHLWAETSSNNIGKEFRSQRPHTHNALDDAREQADIFRQLRRAAGASLLPSGGNDE